MAESKTPHPLSPILYRRFDFTSADLMIQLLRQAGQNPVDFDLESTRIEIDHPFQSTVKLTVREK